MIEFAKLHVEAALKEALESVSYIYKFTGWIWIDAKVEDAVLNAYPLTLIK
jgi:hypothetical protein